MGQFYFLGLDGGGTSSRARLIDSHGHILGEGLAGSSNLTLGAETAAKAIREACDLALQAAGLGKDAYSQIHAGFGLAGANVPELAGALRQQSFGFARLRLGSDAEIACLGAHGGADGAILILGTGSQGLAILHGKTKTLGGWGFLIGDDGSGAQLGRSALRAALRGHENWQAVSELTREIMREFADDPSQMVLWAAKATPRDYGAFAPRVFASHAKGDPVAKALLDESCGYIVTMIEGLLALGTEKIALMGGLAAPFAPLLPEHLRAHLVKPQADALAGALLLAQAEGAT